MNRNEVDINKLSPMMKQYMEIKNNYEDAIVFFRLGDFYEMFFEDGLIASRELEIALTGKTAGLEERIPMCGVPHHSSQVYIDRLVEKGYKVAICEQLELASARKGVVKRGVVRVVSKGTVIDAESLDSSSNNFICSIDELVDTYSITYSDLSTGEMYSTLIEHDYNVLYQELLKLDIKEVVLSTSLPIKLVDKLTKNNDFLLSYINNDDIDDKGIEYCKDIDDVRHFKSTQILISYLYNTQKRSLDHLQNVVIVNNKSYLRFDNQTKKNLELISTLRTKEKYGSLLWFLDQTKTAMGSRMLKSWIEKPSLEKNVLNSRYDMIDKLQSEFFLRDELKNLLDSVYDLERLTTRIAYGSANARDIIWLKRSFLTLPRIKDICVELDYKINVYDFNSLCNLLELSIVEEPPISIKNGGLIKQGYNKNLDVLKDARQNGKNWIAMLEASERERTGIKNLKVGFNKVFGYYIEVTKSQLHLVKEEYGYDRKQTLTNAERYITPELKEKEALILGAEEKIINIEYEIFVSIREEIKKYISFIQKTAKEVAKLDVLQSFSFVSEKNNLIRPQLLEERNIHIVEGRHPVVEKVTGVDYVENDIILNENTDILLITGPNMAGKSTYMRQLALTVIMAQIGCFVPATEAKLPIFDQIFTRIGATDDLTQGQSTFMVEMVEANVAIKYSTDKSLILFDELGRGTATYDGMSLARAIIEYVHNNKKAKTMFSTHYHELTQLSNDLTKLKNVHASAIEDNGEVVFLHKIKEGPTDKSYGIHVAKLASLPDEITTRANKLLNAYENKEEIVIETKIVNTQENNKITNKLKEINPLELTPIEALNILYQLKQEVEQ